MVIAHHVTGTGAAVLLLHGGAEDASMHAALADALAARGRRAIRYDRRGTGASTRDDWPGGGADQHADDAADLLRRLDAVPATVVGFSSGGVVALALAARHPDVVEHAIAWEPPVLSVLPDAEDLQQVLQTPYQQYLAEHPEDWVGGYHVLLDTLSQGRADHDAPTVRASERNAEAMLRDDGPLLTTRAFAPGELPAGKVTIAVSAEPDPLHAAIAAHLAELVGGAPVRVPGADGHEAYLDTPDVVADFLVGASAAR